MKKDKTRRKTPGRKAAKELAALCGMRSMLEVEVATNLDKNKIKWEYESTMFEYHLCPRWSGNFDRDCGVKTSQYTPDFYLPERKIYLEVKGKLTLADRKKMVMVKHHNPDIKIVMVFGAANNKLYARKNSTRYHQWAEKEGFPWCERDINI